MARPGRRDCTDTRARFAIPRPLLNPAGFAGDLLDRFNRYLDPNAITIGLESRPRPIPQRGSADKRRILKLNLERVGSIRRVAFSTRGTMEPTRATGVKSQGVPQRTGYFSSDRESRGLNGSGQAPATGTFPRLRQAIFFLPGASLLPLATTEIRPGYENAYFANVVTFGASRIAAIRRDRSGRLRRYPVRPRTPVHAPGDDTTHRFDHR